MSRRSDYDQLIFKHRLDRGIAPSCWPFDETKRATLLLDILNDSFRIVRVHPDFELRVLLQERSK